MALAYFKGMSIEIITLRASTRFWQDLTPADLQTLLAHLSQVKRQRAEKERNTVQRQRQAVKDTFRRMGA